MLILSARIETIAFETIAFEALLRTLAKGCNRDQATLLRKRPNTLGRLLYINKTV